MTTTAEWDTRFLEMARLVATWSKDPSTHVGAVITDNLNRVISLGYNGFPRRIADSPERQLDRETRLALTIHAEANALAFASRSVAGATLYCTHMPCASCAALIIQHGISRVVAAEPTPDFLQRWRTSTILSEVIFQEAEVELFNNNSRITSSGKTC